MWIPTLAAHWLCTAGTNPVRDNTISSAEISVFLLAAYKGSNHQCAFVPVSVQCRNSAVIASRNHQCPEVVTFWWILPSTLLLVCDKSIFVLTVMAFIVIIRCLWVGILISVAITSFTYVYSSKYITEKERMNQRNRDCNSDFFWMLLKFCFSWGRI